MKISDLKPYQPIDEIVVTVVEVSPVKEFTKFGMTGRVLTALIEDNSGKINLMLWDDQVESVKLGDKIRITDGYVKEYKGEMQVNVGRQGEIVVLKQKVL